MESPTGTGKSLTLLTSTLTWLRQNQKRADEEAEKALRVRLQADDPDGKPLDLFQHLWSLLNQIDPPWVIEHAVKSQLAALHAASEARRDRLKLARERERKARGQGMTGAFRVNGKRAKIASDANGDAGVEGGEEQYLPEDRQGDNEADADGVYLSKEVRDLMAKCVEPCNALGHY